MIGELLNTIKVDIVFSHHGTKNEDHKGLYNFTSFAKVTQVTLVTLSCFSGDGHELHPEVEQRPSIVIPEEGNPP